MSEPPGLPSALGIEAVEWLAQGADNLTVRVGGRWRRRRPTVSGQPQLVIEAGTIRQRFPAMPEPPGLSGAAPGTWQMSFSVPATLARRTGARAWLQFGSIVFPLPVPVAADPSLPDDETLAQRRIRSAELAAESATHRVAEARADAQRLAERVAELELELEQQHDSARARDRARRAAEQRAHAEQALRFELEERLAGATAGPPAADVGERELRIEELEDEVAQLRRAGDEAEQVARTAEVARQRAEEQLAALSLARSAWPSAERLRSELVLSRRHEPAAGAPRRAQLVPADRRHLARERELLATRQRPFARPGSLRARVDAGAPPDPTLAATLDQLREELAGLHAQIDQAVGERDTAERRAAELERDLRERSARSAQVYGAVEQLRAEIAQLRAGGDEPARDAEAGAPARDAEADAPAGDAEAGAPAGDADAEALAAPVSAGPVEAERLLAALTRLRDSAPALEAPAPAAPPAVRSDRWLAPALRAASRRDPESATALLRALLMAPGEEVRAATGLLALGPVRRRWRSGTARLRGRGERYAALRQLLRRPVALEDISLEPPLGLALVAAMIRPRWTVGERFTLAHNEGPMLHVRDGSPVSVTEGLLAPALTTIVCAPETLLRVLGRAAVPGAEASIHGQQRPLELVQAWIQRAQSG